MKNKYKDFIKALTAKTASCLIISRVDDRYYMTEGHIAINVSATTYSVYFHGSKPLIFPTLDSGDCLRNGEKSDIDIQKIFKPFDEYDYTEAVSTPFTKDINEQSVRVHLIYDRQHGKFAAALIDERYYKAVAFLPDMYSGGKNNYPLWYTDGDTVALVLPVSYDKGRDSFKDAEMYASLSSIDLLTVKTA